MTTVSLKSFSTIVDDLDHPEGVATAKNGALFAGGEAGQIYHVSDGKASIVAQTDGFILGLCLDGDDNIYACDNRANAVLRITQEGAVSTFASGNDLRSMATPNYPVFDTAGNLYVSDSGEWDANDGCIWVVRPDGRCEVASESVPAFPNGLAISPDQRHLVVVASQLPGVVRLPIKNGTVVGSPEILCTLPDTVPDGVAFDEAGRLYISCYAPDVILVLERDGTVTTFAEDRQRMTLASPTNLTFSGVERKELVVASLCRWHLSSTPVETPGMTLNYPHLTTGRNA